MEASNHKATSSLVGQMLGVLFAATALGVVFNSFNPNGPSLAEPDAESSETDSLHLPDMPRTGTNIPAQGESDFPGIGVVPVAKWAGVKALLASGGLLLIDARASASYQASHIPGAVSIPAEISDADLGGKTSQYPKSQRMVVYCASESCPYSAALALRLLQLGFTNVQDMRGGLAEYLQAEKEGLK